MALLNNVALWYAKLDPKKPNAKMDKENPTWEVQIRTSDPAQKDDWVTNNLKPKLMVYKEGDPKEGEPMLDDEGRKQWKVVLRKRSRKKDSKLPAADWERTDPPEVVDGGLNPIDPTSIGNGSIANIRIFQHEHVYEGKPGVSSVLMKIQIIKHIIYVPKPFDDDFSECETEVIAPQMEDSDTPDPKF